MSSAARLSRDAGPATGVARGPSGASADPAGRAGSSLPQGPRIVEVRVQGGSRGDKADLLAIVAALLTAQGFETCPPDCDPPSLDVVLPADWRDLPIVRAVVGGGAS